MARSLDFYLGLGCEVRCAADGWVLLGCGPTLFVLVQITAAGQTRLRPARWVRLTTPDVRALRWRLLTKGVALGPIITPGNTAEIRVTDPDRYCVVIAEPEQPAAPQATTADRVRPATRPGSRVRVRVRHLVSIETPLAAG